MNTRHKGFLKTYLLGTLRGIGQVGTKAIPQIAYESKTYTIHTTDRLLTGDDRRETTTDYT
jgi:hypothetical protein